jgi:hypothetical protein
LGFQSWQDVLALVYGGQDNATHTVDCNSAKRAMVVNNWSNLFQDGCTNAEPTCNDSVHGGKLWHAFRPDDSSPVAQVFASLLGLSPASSAGAVNGFGASPYCNAMNWDTSPANAHCAAGAAQQFVGPGGVDDGTGTGHRVPPPGTYGTVAQGLQPYVFPTGYQDNDPIRRPCIGNGSAGRAGEDVCNDDGQLGLVVSVPSVEFIPNQNPGLVAFPTTPTCNAGFIAGDPPRVFLCAPRGTVQNGLCPNNDPPLGIGCFVPIGQGPSGNTSQCFNSKSNLPICFTGPCGTDGRVFNLQAYDGTGTDTVHNVHYLTVPNPGSTGRTLDFVASFARIHEQDTVPTGLSACQGPDGMSQIGCLVSADRCSLGLSNSSANIADNASIRVNQLTQ